MIPDKIHTILSLSNSKWQKKDIETLASYFSTLKDDVKCNEWANAILRTIEIMKKQGVDSNEILAFISKAKNAFIHSSPRSNKQICDMLEEECILYINIGEMDKAFQCAKDYLFWAISHIKKTAANNAMGYFSFRTFSKYSLSDIKNETISLAHPSVFNDPLDTMFLFSLECYIKNLSSLPKEKQEFKLMLKKATNYIKLRCFVGNRKDGNEVLISDVSNLMWAHYANGHRGFCVEYTLDDDFFNQNEQDSLIFIHEIDYQNQLLLDGNLSIRKMLLQKAADWSYENEMRLLFFSPNNNNAYPTLKCPNCIKAIYLGTKCSELNAEEMRKAIGNKNIPLYRMEVNKKDLTHLDPVRIG